MASKDWTSTFLDEMSRRRKLMKQKPDVYKKVWRVNPKGIHQAKDCDEHIWIPATHVAIHDSTSKHKLSGVIKSRGFTEAKPFVEDGVTVVPQVCNHCDATRELEIHIRTTAERLADQEANKPKTKYQKNQHIVASFDSLLGMVG